MNLGRVVAASAIWVGLVILGAAQGAAPALKPAADAIVKSDAQFAQSVAETNRQKFLSFIADATTFGGGTATELHGRDAVVMYSRRLAAWMQSASANDDSEMLKNANANGDNAGRILQQCSRELNRRLVAAATTIRTARNQENV